jgi:hypothetical protein
MELRDDLFEAVYRRCHGAVVGSNDEAPQKNEGPTDIFNFNGHHFHGKSHFLRKKTHFGTMNEIVL